MSFFNTELHTNNINYDSVNASTTIAGWRIINTGGEVRGT